jgi:hypothetical protein
MQVNERNMRVDLIRLIEADLNFESVEIKEGEVMSFCMMSDNRP